MPHIPSTKLSGLASGRVEARVAPSNMTAKKEEKNNPPAHCTHLSRSFALRTTKGDTSDRGVLAQTGGYEINKLKVIPSILSIKEYSMHHICSTGQLFRYPKTKLLEGTVSCSNCAGIISCLVSVSSVGASVTRSQPRAAMNPVLNGP
jgi:hypothetical protein